MPDQETKPTVIEESSEIGKPQKFARTLAWVIPLVILIVIFAIVALALIGPSIGNIYSDIGIAI